MATITTMSFSSTPERRKYVEMVDDDDDNSTNFEFHHPKKLRSPQVSSFLKRFSFKRTVAETHGKRLGFGVGANKTEEETIDYSSTCNNICDHTSENDVNATSAFDSSILRLDSNSSEDDSHVFTEDDCSINFFSAFHHDSHQGAVVPSNMDVSSSTSVSSMNPAVLTSAGPQLNVALISTALSASQPSLLNQTLSAPKSSLDPALLEQSSSHHVNVSTMSSSSSVNPRIVQLSPLSEDNSPANRMVHPQTADGQYEHATKVEGPSSVSSGLRYSLKHGKKGMSTSLRKKSKSKIAAVFNKPRQLATNLKKPVPELLSISDNAYKIFVLLLDPKSKIFELIQLLYDPSDATIGDIINMIPVNATEPILGKQKYYGLCRPIEVENITDLKLFASADSSREERRSARITRGEILVGIPDGFTGRDVAVLSRQILQNDKIRRLLEKSDPLVLQSESRLNTKHSKGHSSVDAMEKYSEEKCQFETNFTTRVSHTHARHTNQVTRLTSTSQDEIMKQAMEKAKEAAANANSAVPSPSKTQTLSSDDEDQHEQDDVTNALHSLEDKDAIMTLSSSSASAASSRYSGHRSRQSLRSIRSNRRHRASCDDSLDMSYASWSKSLDTSLASQITARRRRQQRSKHAKFASVGSVLLFGAMVLRYFMDPNGYESCEEGELIDIPMGLPGLIQFTSLFILIIKLQYLYCNDVNPARSHCPFLQGVAKIIARLQHHRAKMARKAEPTKSCVVK